jgi:hypothetical protein
VKVECVGVVDWAMTGAQLRCQTSGNRCCRLKEM